jgi:hypothetical protein
MLFKKERATCFLNSKNKGVLNFIMHPNALVTIGASQEMNTHWVY